jgi:hypothetical protein
MAMSDYLSRFLAMLEELRVVKSDPLYEKAHAANQAMIDLGIAVVMSSKPPHKTK